MKEDYFDINEINQMQKFVDDYEYTQDELETTIKALLKRTKDKSLQETIKGIKEYIKDNEGSRYDEYKEKIAEFEDFNINDYNDNEGIWEDYQRDIMEGLR